MSLINLSISNASQPSDLLQNASVFSSPSISSSIISSSSFLQTSSLVRRIPLEVLARMTTYLNACQTLALRNVCSFFKKASLQTEEMLFATTPIDSSPIRITDPRHCLTRLNADQIIYATSNECVVWDALKENKRLLEVQGIRFIANLNNDAIAYIANGRARAVGALQTSTPTHLEDPEMMRHWAVGLIPLNAHQVVCYSWNGEIRRWDLETGHLGEVFKVHNTAINTLTLLGEEQLISASTDQTLKIWNIKSQIVLQTLKGHTDNVWDVAALGKNHAVSASQDGTLIVWNTTNGIALKTLKGHRDAVIRVIALSTHLIASGSSDKTIRIWDAFSGIQLKTLSLACAPARLFLLNKHTLISSSSTLTILWEVSRPLISRAIFSAISEKIDKNIKIPFVSIVTNYLFGDAREERKGITREEGSTNLLT